MIVNSLQTNLLTSELVWYCRYSETNLCCNEWLLVLMSRDVNNPISWHPQRITFEHVWHVWFFTNMNSKKWYSILFSWDKLKMFSHFISTSYFSTRFRGTTRISGANGKHQYYILLHCLWLSVRPLIKYASSVWSPYQIELIKKVKSVRVNSPSVCMPGFRTTRRGLRGLALTI